jgi:hypothetical protein
MSIETGSVKWALKKFATACTAACSTALTLESKVTLKDMETSGGVRQAKRAIGFDRREPNRRTLTVKSTFNK